MRIKRTYAATMREALAQVKLEQGPDAVILGNKKVPGGVEILSAVDFDHRSVDAYAGDPAMPLSDISMPDMALNNSRLTDATDTPQRASINKELESSSPSGSIAGMSFDSALDIEFEGRKEPVLGVRQKNEAEAVVPRPQTAKPQSSLKVAASSKQRAAVNKTSQQKNKSQATASQQNTRTSAKSAPVANSSALPVEEEARLRQLQSERLLNSIRDEGFKAESADEKQDNRSDNRSSQFMPQQSNSNQPIIDEVKDELKNLRNLMQSQLNVLEWEKYNQRHPVRSVLLNLMTELGLGTDICEMIFADLGEFNEDPHKVWQKALGLLAKAIPMSNNDILTQGGRIALVGSTGVGKTTTIAKLAARFAHTHGNRSVALITTDNFRIGAQEQLQHFARMLEIPLLTANDSDELTDRLKMLTDKKLVLIDTAGMSQTDVSLSERFHTLHTGSPEIRPYLVLSANTQMAALNETIKNFSKTRLAGTIVTKLDESASMGGIITTAIRHQLPLSYCGVGQRVPEDLKMAKNHSLVSKAVSLMQKYGEQIDKETLAYRYQNLISNQSV